MKKIIYAIDDEQDILDILEMNLSREGFDVKVFLNAESALASLNTIIPDIIILDIMMDGMDGYDFCKEIKAAEDFKDIPIIFLSAKSDEFDKVLSLELGGDDFMTKPFSIKELKSRIKAVLRRSDKTIVSSMSEDKIQFLGIILYPQHYRLTVDGSEVQLTKTEFGILYLFLKNPGKIFTRDNIIDSIRGNDVFVVDRTIDVHVMNLRKKLDPYKKVIKTFSGVGYGLREHDA
jgi:two-component system, OmpR family, alkaline phosphatase synthesis response regulator PhoP